jgi:hypothetical protein
MKRLMLAGCALAALTGWAVAQGATTQSQQPAQNAPAVQQQKAPAAQQSSQQRGTNAPSTAASQPGVQRIDGTALAVTFYTANPADFRASKIIGQPVYNLANENIGEVNDLVIDNGKTVKAIVVGVGGFLGMGERNVAIAPSSMVMSEQQDGAAKLVVNTTKDQLKNAKPFDFAEIEKSGPNAGKTTGSGAGSSPSR